MTAGRFPDCTLKVLPCTEPAAEKEFWATRPGLTKPVIVMLLPFRPPLVPSAVWDIQAAFAPGKTPPLLLVRP